jgi:hypothetical protein
MKRYFNGRGERAGTSENERERRERECGQLWSVPKPAVAGCNFGLGAVLRYSNTPSLRVAGFDDEDENEAPCEVARSRLVT